MTLDSYLLFVGASIVLVIVPGPDMLYLLGRSIAQGRKAGFMAALGFNVGGYCHLLAAILGLSAILATSALAFSIVKWAGAAYLIYLGIQTLRGTNRALVISEKDSAQRELRTIFWQAFLSDVLNPKVALFFVALLPQFVETQSHNRVGQLLLLGVTVNVIAILINMLIVLFAVRVTATLRESDTINAMLHKLMGAVFIGLGLRLAGEKS
jgi:threonine/homoserine/homoserine lactone efflux protein